MASSQRFATPDLYLATLKSHGQGGILTRWQRAAVCPLPAQLEADQLAGYELFAAALSISKDVLPESIQQGPHFRPLVDMFWRRQHPGIISLFHSKASYERLQRQLPPRPVPVYMAPPVMGLGNPPSAHLLQAILSAIVALVYHHNSTPASIHNLFTPILLLLLPKV